MTNERAQSVEWFFRTIITLLIAGAVSGGTFIVVAKVQLPSMEKRITTNEDDIKKIKAGEVGGQVGETPRRLDAHTASAERTLQSIDDTMKMTAQSLNDLKVSVATVSANQDGMSKDIDELKSDIRQLREGRP